MATQFSQSSSSSLVENQNWPDEINSNCIYPPELPTHPLSQSLNHDQYTLSPTSRTEGKIYHELQKSDRTGRTEINSNAEPSAESSPSCRNSSFFVCSDHFRVLSPLQPASHAVRFDIANRPFPVLMLVCRKLTLLSQSAIAANQFLSPFSNVLPRIDYPESHPSS